MAVFVLPEHALTVQEVAARCGVSTTTVRAWHKLGLPVGGQRVYLRAVRVGKGLRVGEDALAEFLTALNGGARVELAEQRTRRQRQAEAADREARQMLGLPAKK